MATITITVQSLLNAAQYDTYTVSDAITVASLKGDIQTSTGVDQDWFDLVFDDVVLNDGSTLSSYGIINGSVLRSGNVIDSLPTLQDRQVAKLDLAELKRIEEGSIYSNYDINLLPSKYVGNVSTPNVHPTGLVEGRPWIPSVITSGLSMYLNAGDPLSYSGSGTTWIDLSGAGADQTLFNTPTYTAGPPAYFSFNGVNEYSVGSLPFVIPPNTYTKIVWFQLNGVGDNNLVSSSAGGHFMFFAGTSTLYVGNANNPPYGPGGFGSVTTFSTGTWYCAAVVFSAPQIWIYVNGVEDAFDPTYGPAHSGDGSVNLACFGPGGNLLNGKIAEVYCYSRALTAAEILHNFNATRAAYGL